MSTAITHTSAESVPATPSRLVDTFGRVHDSLRLSVTDRCNLRCHYCMPEEGVPFVERDRLMSFEQIVAVVQVACDLGVRALRITGGEPLLRRDLPELIGMLRRHTSLEDISLTTNGMLLERHAAALADSGLDRLNVSLDSLRPERFAQITRWGAIERVWRGLEEAARRGIDPIKINTLVLEGFNDDEIDQWLELTRRWDITVRFMELMPVGDNALEDVGGFVDLSQLRRRLEATRGLRPADTDEAHRGNGPARYWKLPGARGCVGFITPMSHSYCNNCSRLRLTATGELRACLAHDEQVNLAHAIARDDRRAIRAGFLWAVDNKPAGHRWRHGETTAVGMSQVGG